MASLSFSLEEEDAILLLMIVAWCRMFRVEVVSDGFFVE